ncbi:MAG: hypothetical protein IJ195_00890 [Lachnospiraceae bacterium]|nr:hypothetical protein [Lachnospiraceae bacterium]
MKKKSLILTAACAALIMTASIGSAFAYFSTYEKAMGGYVIHLGHYEEIPEEFQDWTKKVVIKNRADSLDDVYVRVKAFAGSTVNLQYIGDARWTPASDGFYYYSDSIKPGESTAEIDVKISNIPAGVDPQSFNVVVIYEATKVKYRADGTAYADWSELLDVTYEEEGDK